MDSQKKEGEIAIYVNAKAIPMTELIKIADKFGLKVKSRGYSDVALVREENPDARVVPMPRQLVDRSKVAAAARSLSSINNDDFPPGAA